MTLAGHLVTVATIVDHTVEVVEICGSGVRVVTSTLGSGDVFESTAAVEPI